MDVKGDPYIQMTPDYVYGYSGMNTEKAGADKSGDGKSDGYDTSDLKESFQIWCVEARGRGRLIRG
jgi:hypothetical protein